jgi:hypothetical protein
MNISYVRHIELLAELSRQNSNSLEFIILVTGALDTCDKQSLFSLLREAARALKNGGILFVQGMPRVLPELGVFLEKQLMCKKLREDHAK